MIVVRFGVVTLALLAASTHGVAAAPDPAAGDPAEQAGPTLIVTPTGGLDPEGDTVSVIGAGYDETRGVYVALCVVPPPGAAPTPCGGGIDLEGDGGASRWISSDPPDYGLGLAQPYGPGGTFEVEVRVEARLSDRIDCRQVQCAIVSRADHTRLADRSLDLIVPVFFAATSAEANAATATTSTTTTTTIAAAATGASPGTLPEPRGAAPTWPVWVGSAAVATGIVAIAPRRRSTGP